MKRNLLLTAGGLLLTAGIANAQCSITGLNATYCLNDAPATIGATDYGYFTGNGMAGNVFDPAVAGVGTHTINYYQYDPAPTTYTVDQTGAYALIAGTGTTVSLGDDQVTAAAQPIGFTFNFFGVNYTNFYLSSNGFLTFNNDMNSACCSGQAIPNLASPNNFIAWSWDDMYPPGAGSYQYFVTGSAPYQMLVINFFDIPFCCGTTPVVKMQVVLHESTNIIDINTEYANGVNPGTMGIENATGSAGYSVPGRNGAAWPNLANDHVSFIPAIICTSTQDVTVYDLPTVVAAVDFSTVCEGDDVIFTGSGADSYLWDNGATDGVPYTTTVTNTFTVTGTDLNGCTDTDAIMVNVNPAPPVTAMVDLNPVCAGTTVIFTGGGADLYSWDNGVTDGVGFVATVSGDYTVTGFESVNGCSKTAFVTLVVNDLPVIVLTPTDEMTANDGTITTVVTGNGPFTYDWDNDGTGDFDDNADLTGLAPGTYTLVVEDANGCLGTNSTVVSSQVGLEDLSGVEFTIHPNPSTGVFQITLSTLLTSEVVTVEIVNSLGQKVMGEVITSNVTNVNISGNPAGIYFVKIITAKGTTVKPFVLK